MLIKAVNELKPDYIAACYDRAEATFRKQIYDDYKGGRAKTDEALITQLIRSRDIFPAFSIPIYDAPGFEADDMIGTIVEQVKKEKNLKVIIASGDMDTLQLVVGNKVVVYTLKKGNQSFIYDEAAVQERFGLSPSLLPDYKGLAGDQSDNIVGIKGIGEKTATTLLQNFGTIEQMYEKLKTAPEKFKEAGIKERIVTLLQEGEEEALFSKTLATIRRDAPISFSLPEQAWRESVNLEQAEKILTELDFRSLRERLRGAVAGESRVAEGGTKAVKGEKVAKPEPVPPPREVAIAFSLLNSEITNPNTEEILNYTKAGDLVAAKEVLENKLSEAKLIKVYQDIELPLLPLIIRAEEHGVLVDVEYLKNLSVEYHAKLKGIAGKVYEQVGEEFNLNSPQQLGNIIFDKLGLAAKGLKKTAGGARSTRESELLKLADQHPVIGDILAYRELQKLLSTYIDTIPTLVDANNRLHTHLNQLGAATGRMSSTNPNLQNIPASGELGLSVRRAFIAAPGHKLVSFDYSQIEMRVLALLSGDENLIKIFQSGTDVHTAVASQVFAVPAGQVTSEMRRRAKVINFGIVYGMGVNALKVNLKSTRDEAAKFYEEYFVAFPSIRAYFEKVKTEARTQGYTETLFGRRRYFPGIHSPIPPIKAANERMAVNAPVQGTAADIFKIALRQADEVLEQHQLRDKVQLLLPVHDELIYEVAEGAVEQTLPLITSAMEQVLANSKVPLVANSGVGNNWAELK
jgi:DNA polymerase-1